jgi:photosystem II stability/assembly factor-like uncharacterized protein
MLRKVIPFLILGPIILFILNIFDEKDHYAHSDLIRMEEKLYPYEGLYLAKQYPNQEVGIQAREAAIRNAIHQMENGMRSDGVWEVQGPGNLGGRVNTISVSPFDDNIIFIGFSNGGVWRTLDAGENWEPVFDGQPLTAIGDITFHPEEENTVFVGTGDPNIGGYYFVGNGLFKSEDLGQNWTYLGLKDQSIISTIAISSINPDLMYAGTMGKPYERNQDRGVYKSIDGGQTWEQSLFIDEQTGVIEVIVDPNNDQIVYASTWTRIRTNKESTINSDMAGVFRTTDGGATWTRLTNGLPVDPFSRVGIAMSPDNSKVLFCVIIGTNQNPEGLYKTEDGGASWEKWNIMNDEFANYTRGFGWYFGKLGVYPGNENKVFLLGVDLYLAEKKDTVEFVKAAPGWGTYEVHADKHDIVFANGKAYLGTDGGLYKTVLSEDTLIWENAEDIPTNQFYRVAYNPHDPDYYVGGMQDNGTGGGNKFGIKSWDRIRGGDGFQPAFYKSDPLVWFAETQRGGLSYSEDGGASWQSFTQGLGGNRHWDMQYIISPHNDSIVFTVTSKVMVSRSGLPEQWEELSDTIVDFSKDAFIHQGTSIDQSSINPALIYAGTSDGLVWGTTDGGSNWIHFEDGLPDRYVSSIKASPNVESNVYVTFSGYRDGDYTPHIFKSEDYGQTWTAIHGDLPNLAINDVYVYPYKTQDEVLFVGTDLGVYFTVDNGMSWERLGENMPMVPTFDMDLNHEYNQLIAGTYGRSIMTFELDQIGITQEVSTTNQPDVVDLKVYPNPVIEKLFIKCEGPEEKVASLYSYDGRLVKEAMIQYGRGEIDVSNFPGGKYFLKIGQQSKSIIIQK